MGPKVNILITGLPGSGKTTLFRKLATDLRRFRPVGFYTEEIREDGVRKGFALKSLDGREGVLAHVGFPGRSRVGKYGVDIAGFENFLAEIPFDAPQDGLIMIDEIGKMECLSTQFRRLVNEFLDSERMLIATIAQHGGGLIAEVKRREDVRIYTLRPQNRDTMAGSILQQVAS